MLNKFLRDNDVWSCFFAKFFAQVIFTIEPHAQQLCAAPNFACQDTFSNTSESGTRNEYHAPNSCVVFVLDIRNFFLIPFAWNEFECITTDCEDNFLPSPHAQIQIFKVSQTAHMEIYMQHRGMTKNYPQWALGTAVITSQFSLIGFTTFEQKIGICSTFRMDRE